MVLLEKKYSVTILKDGETEFIQDYPVGWNGILKGRRKTGLNSKYNMGKWEFITKEQDGSQ